MFAKTAKLPPDSFREGEHIIGEFIENAGGATLIVVGSIHGNERGGSVALRKVSHNLKSLREKLRGRIYLLKRKQ
jgi:predicted deacylase